MFEMLCCHATWWSRAIATSVSDFGITFTFAPLPLFFLSTLFLSLRFWCILSDNHSVVPAAGPKPHLGTPWPIHYTILHPAHPRVSAPHSLLYCQFAAVRIAIATTTNCPAVAGHRQDPHLLPILARSCNMSHTTFGRGRLRFPASFGQWSCRAAAAIWP